MNIQFGAKYKFIATPTGGESLGAENFSDETRSKILKTFSDGRLNPIIFTNNRGGFLKQAKDAHFPEISIIDISSKDQHEDEFVMVVTQDDTDEFNSNYKEFEESDLLQTYIHAFLDKVSAASDTLVLKPNDHLGE